MFLSVTHNPSGEEYVKQLGPNASCDLRAYVRQWCADNYDAAPVFSEPGSHIPQGCGEYQAEIRRTKRANASCWCAEPFYLEAE